MADYYEEAYKEYEGEQKKKYKNIDSKSLRFFFIIFGIILAILAIGKVVSYLILIGYFILSLIILIDVEKSSGNNIITEDKAKSVLIQSLRKKKEEGTDEFDSLNGQFWCPGPIRLLRERMNEEPFYRITWKHFDPAKGVADDYIADVLAYQGIIKAFSIDDEGFTGQDIERPVLPEGRGVRIIHVPQQLPYLINQDEQRKN